MALPAPSAADPSFSGPLGTLALSVVSPRSADLTLRALKWHGGLARLGIRVPLVLVHDLGLLLAVASSRLDLRPRTEVDRLVVDRALVSLLHAYQDLILEIARHEAVIEAPSFGLNDEAIAALLGWLLGPCAGGEASYESDVPLEVELLEQLDERLPDLFARVPREHDLRALARFVQDRVRVLGVLDAWELDTLQALGLVGPGVTGDSLHSADELLPLLATPEAHQVLDLFLEMLPNLLAAKVHEKAGTRSASAGEPPPREGAGPCYLLVDGSASMRGQRATLARGMALAVAAKLLSAGQEVRFQFFDARLYPPRVAMRPGHLPLAHVASFKAERGRNPTRVFQELAAQLELEALRDARQPIVRVFTHAGLYIPRETVAAVTRRARLLTFFLLPSGKAAELDYLDLLDSYWFVGPDVALNGSALREAGRFHERLGSPGSAPPRPDRAPDNAAAAALGAPTAPLCAS